MRSRTPGVLGFRFDRNLALRWPAISKAVEMLLGQVDLYDTFTGLVRIPMMSISRSEVMAISAERSDARLFQCESVIGIRQGF